MLAMKTFWSRQTRVFGVMERIDTSSEIALAADQLDIDNVGVDSLEALSRYQEESQV